MKAEPRSSSMSKAHSLLSMTSMSIRQDCSDLYQQVEHWRIKVQLWAKDHQCTCVYRNLNPESNQAVEAMDGALATAIRVPKAMARNPTQMRNSSQTNSASQPNLLRSTTAPLSHAVKAPLEGLDEEDRVTSTDSSTTLGPTHHQDRLHHHRNQAKSLPPPLDLESNGKRTSFSASSMDDTQQRHHHHVPTNAFLSIGLQTSIAIALHKLPEGFITFATNHANPKLGFAVFMALFIHNITEGFAMALPLYLAIGSRLKSMFWSSLLGGASQPLGAGLAALWFKMARTSDKAPGETLYGCMFALTGGVMAAVALQLFAESLALNHNRNLCMTFAFVGMGILGTSFALTAG
ncbi:MAG: hypothetical protein LQ345_004071 [Seirophora villosa]|nr:MAG: hypothetical protein LQ345_004071 [Seirophora villosa]